MRTRSEAAKEPKKPIRPIEFDNANKAVESKMVPDFERITESIIVVDIWTTYEKLEKALELGDRRTDRGALLQALDQAERNARLAHRLWMTAKVEFRRWYLDSVLVHGVMRREANKVLQQEKEQGLRNKAITEADIENMAVALYPDEYKAQEIRRTKIENMLESMKNLNELWFKRAQSLSTMAHKQR